MEELQLHAAVTRKEEESVLHGAIKDKSLAVDVFIDPVEIRRTEDIRPRHVSCQPAFRCELVCPVISPDRIAAAFLLLGKGLEVGFGIYRTGTDQNIIVKSDAGLDKRRDVLLRVGGDI